MSTMTKSALIGACIFAAASFAASGLRAEPSMDHTPQPPIAQTPKGGSCVATSTREKEIERLKKSIERRKKHIARLKEHIADKQKKIDELKNSKDKFIDNRVGELERDIWLNQQELQNEESDLNWEEKRLQGLESGEWGC